MSYEQPVRSKLVHYELSEIQIAIADAMHVPVVAKLVEKLLNASQRVERLRDREVLK